jgi:hypothetical protein
MSSKQVLTHEQSSAAICGFGVHAGPEIPLKTRPRSAPQANTPSSADSNIPVQSSDALDLCLAYIHTSMPC